MIKIEALEWLVENVTRWPTSRGGIVSTPDGWSWGESCEGDVWLFTNKPSGDYIDCHITQGEWSNGVRALFSISDAFDWLYGEYGRCFNNWPTSPRCDNELKPPKGWVWVYNCHADEHSSHYGMLTRFDNSNVRIFKHQIAERTKGER